MNKPLERMHQLVRSNEERLGIRRTFVRQSPNVSFVFVENPDMGDIVSTVNELSETFQIPKRVIWATIWTESSKRMPDNIDRDTQQDLSERRLGIPSQFKKPGWVATRYSRSIWEYPGVKEIWEVELDNFLRYNFALPTVVKVHALPNLVIYGRYKNDIYQKAVDGSMVDVGIMQINIKNSDLYPRGIYDLYRLMYDFKYNIWSGVHMLSEAKGAADRAIMDTGSSLSPQTNFNQYYRVVYAAYNRWYTGAVATILGHTNTPLIEQKRQEQAGQAIGYSQNWLSNFINEPWKQLSPVYYFY